MKPLLLYLLQVIICSGILYGYYHFFLRNKKFHQYNRYFLLTATLISILIPFLNIPVYFTKPEEDAIWLTTLSGISSQDSILFISRKSAEGSTIFTLKNLLIGIYSLTALLILIRFTLSIFKLKRIINKHEVEKIEDINFLNTEERGTPFSFFNWMFWNKNIALDSDNGQQIFRHELFHIRQKHSRDIVFLELLTMIFWINPFFHLIKKELITIHEFLADKFAIKETDKWNYAELLLMHLMGTPSLRLTNPFFHNQIKRRIAMITSSQQPKYQYLRKMLVLPLLAIVAILFAFTYKQRQLSELTEERQLQELSAAMEQNQATPTDTPKVKLSAQTKTIAATKIVIHPATETDNKQNKLYIVDGKMYSSKQFEEKFGKVFEYNGEVHITEANDAEAIAKYGEKAKDGIIEFKKSAQKEPTPIKGISVSNIEKKPLYIVNGVRTNETGLNKIEPSTIKEINVLKNESATSLYGEQGKNGVIEIKLKPLDEVIVEGKQTDNLRKAKTEEKSNLDEVVVEGKLTGTLQKIKIEEKKNLDEIVVVGYAKSTNDKVFLESENPPSFPGGQDAWRKYLTTQLNPSVPVDKGSPAGHFTVSVQFIVDKEGNISDIKPLTNHGYGMEEEVIRIIKSGPKWIPGTQNGKTVKAYTKQPVTFVIAEEDNDEPKTVAGYKTEKPFTANEIDRLTAIYPNPANNIVNIPYNATVESNAEIIVRDISGKIHLRQKTNLTKGTNNLSLNISSLENGTYLITVSDTKQPLARTYKVIKQ